MCVSEWINDNEWIWILDCLKKLPFWGTSNGHRDLGQTFLESAENSLRHDGPFHPFWMCHSREKHSNGAGRGPSHTTADHSLHKNICCKQVTTQAALTLYQCCEVVLSHLWIENTCLIHSYSMKFRYNWMYFITVIWLWKWLKSRLKKVKYRSVTACLGNIARTHPLYGKGEFWTIWGCRPPSAITKLWNPFHTLGMASCFYTMTRLPMRVDL